MTKSTMKIYVSRRFRAPQTRYHHLFVCSHERRYCTRLSVYTAGKIMIRLVDVPGNRHLVLLHRELAEVARALTKQLVSWMLDLHSLNRSFDGQFSENHIYVTPAKQIKILTSQRKFFRALTSEGRKKDRCQIAKIIEAMLLPGTDGAQTVLPYDVAHLLEVLWYGNDDDDFVIARHPGAMTWTEKLCLFNECFTQMEALEIRDPEKYRRIIESLPYNGEWIDLIAVHGHLSDVFHWRNRDEAYTPETSSMLQVKRNSFTHLVKMHSMKVKKRKVKVNGVLTEERKVEILFKYKQIALMFGFTFPQVTAILQLCLHREGELRNVYEEEEDDEEDDD